MLTGANIAGGNPANGRVKDDFYATNPKAVQMLLDAISFPVDGKYLEPCVGQGHIAKVIKQNFPQSQLTAIDLVDRGYPETVVCNFLQWQPDGVYDEIITNPPFSLATEFIEKGMSLLRDGGHCSIFMKIQFLEGEKRRRLFDTYPPRWIYVFRKRMDVFAEGMEMNPKTGKKWSTTFCFAWFVFEKGYKGEPIIRWLD